MQAKIVFEDLLRHKKMSTWEIVVWGRLERGAPVRVYSYPLCLIRFGGLVVATSRLRQIHMYQW